MSRPRHSIKAMAVYRGSDSSIPYIRDKIYEVYVWLSYESNTISVRATRPGFPTITCRLVDLQYIFEFV